MLQVDLTHSDANKKPRRPRSFRDQMAPIFQALSQRSANESIQPVRPRVALFSATIPDEVTQWYREELSQLLTNTSASGAQDDGKLIELYIGKR